MTGFCSAAFGLAGPVYIGEIAAPQVPLVAPRTPPLLSKVRGGLSSLVSTLVSIGLLYIMAIGSVLQVARGPPLTPGQPWQSALLCLPWSLAGFLLLLLVPDSPSHLARWGHRIPLPP